MTGLPTEAGTYDRTWVYSLNGEYGKHTDRVTVQIDKEGFAYVDYGKGARSDCYNFKSAEWRRVEEPMTEKTAEKKNRTDWKGLYQEKAARVEELESRLAEIDKDTTTMIKLITEAGEASALLDGEETRLVGGALLKLATRAELLNIHIQGGDELEFWREREGI